MDKYLNLTAPLNSLGYGVVAWNVLSALDKLGVNVALWPLGQISPLHFSAEEKELAERCSNNRVLFNQYAPSLRIWHQFDMAQHVGKGLRCGFPFFELDTFHKNERHHLGYLDRILVSCTWAKRIVEKEIPYTDNVFVCPMGVDRSIFNPYIVGESPRDDRTVFLNMGKWEVRKGHDVLVEAFNAAFTKEDRVTLIMANENPFLNEQQRGEWGRSYKESPLGDKIVLTSRLQTHREVANLMATAHCGVFPSRGEGWNMEALEMLSLGKQLIITDYSAHSDFCDHENSKLIPMDEVEPAYDGIWFKGEPNDRGYIPQWGYFGDLQFEALVEHLRAVNRQRIEGFPMMNEAGIKTAEKFSWEQCAEKILDATGLTGQLPPSIIQV